MKIRDGFLKARLGGQTYVLPYGQNLADHYRGIALNETGKILWEGLESGSTREELVHRLQTEFQLEDNMSDRLRQDVEDFEKHLTDVGILMDDEENIYGWQKPTYFAIGPLKIAYRGPDSIYEQYFKKFACEAAQNADLTIQISCLPYRFHKNGRVVLRSDEIVLMDTGKEYVFLFLVLPAVKEMHLKKDGSYALMLCKGDLIAERGEDIFHAIRFTLLAAAILYARQGSCGSNEESD